MDNEDLSIMTALIGPTAEGQRSRIIVKVVGSSHGRCFLVCSPRADYARHCKKKSRGQSKRVLGFEEELVGLGIVLLGIKQTFT